MNARERSIVLTNDDGFAGKFVALTKFLVYILIILIWTVFGFLMWIPLIFRMMLLFTGSVIEEAIVANKNYTALIEARLNYAIAFYPSTFNRIGDSIFGNPDKIEERPDMKGDLKLILFEVGWSITCWALSTYVIMA